MPELYNFAWIHERAKRVQFGTIEASMRIHEGQIVNVEIAVTKESQSLKQSLEAQKKREDIL